MYVLQYFYFILFSPFIESSNKMNSLPSTSSSTATSSNTVPFHTQCDFRDRYGRPYWAVTTTIPIQTQYGNQKCFVTCMNIHERINEIWRPYLPDTPITRVSVHPPPSSTIDPNQFITEYEEILNAKVQRLEKELVKEQLEKPPNENRIARYKRQVGVWPICSIYLVFIYEYLKNKKYCLLSLLSMSPTNC